MPFVPFVVKNMPRISADVYKGQLSGSACRVARCFSQDTERSSKQFGLRALRALRGKKHAALHGPQRCALVLQTRPVKLFAQGAEAAMLFTNLGD